MSICDSFFLCQWYIHQFGPTSAPSTFLCTLSVNAQCTKEAPTEQRLMVTCGCLIGKKVCEFIFIYFSSSKKSLVRVLFTLNQLKYSYVMTHHCPIEQMLTSGMKPSNTALPTEKLFSWWKHRINELSMYREIDRATYICTL